MKRSPMQRGKPLARGTRINPVNRKRKAATFARNFGDRGEAVRAMRCLVAVAMLGSIDRNASNAWVYSSSYCRPPFETQAAHATARGMGGAKGDRRDLVPLCAKHHAEAGEARTSARADFERRYSLDLQAEAARIAAELDDRGIE